MEMGPKVTLNEGLDLRLVQSTGSVLHINSIYDDAEGPESGETETSNFDTIGEPVRDFKSLEEKMSTVDSNGYVKKLILEEGGGMPINEDYTVFVAFSAYWENANEPFDVMTIKKPLEVDLKDNGLLLGLEMAIKTMLVGELSIFLFSHKVMYGELGITPRLKAAAQCVFYIKLLRSVLTPKEGKLSLSEPNMFQRVKQEVMMLYSSGFVVYKSMNIPAAVNLFKKAVAMLHKCRLADENEEKQQEKLLKKLYMNLALCYNKLKQPLKACIACNELNRLNCLWNDGKALFQNAKALRMIGQYDRAERMLKRAIKLSPENKEMTAELALITSTRDSCNQNKLVNSRILGSGRETISDQFKAEVDSLVINFKNNVNLCKITLPGSLNAEEMDYVKVACIRENLFFNKISRNDAMYNQGSYGINEEPSNSKSEEALGDSFVMDKEDVQSADERAHSELTSNEDMFDQVQLLIKTPLILSTEKK